MHFLVRVLRRILEKRSREGEEQGGGGKTVLSEKTLSTKVGDDETLVPYSITLLLPRKYCERGSRFQYAPLPTSLFALKFPAQF